MEIAVIGILFVLFVMIASVAFQYRRVGPNEVLVISGRRRVIVNPAEGEQKMAGFRVAKGGGVFVWPIIERADVLSLKMSAASMR